MAISQKPTGVWRWNPQIGGCRLASHRASRVWFGWIRWAPSAWHRRRIGGAGWWAWWGATLWTCWAMRGCSFWFSWMTSTSLQAERIAGWMCGASLWGWRWQGPLSLTRSSVAVSRSTMWVIGWTTHALRSACPRREQAGSLVLSMAWRRMAGWFWPGDIRSFMADWASQPRSFLGWDLCWPLVIHGWLQLGDHLRWRCLSSCIFIRHKFQGGLRRIPCTHEELELGEIFRTDAKCEPGKVVLGGWSVGRSGNPLEATWFSLEVLPSDAPWLFRGEGSESSWASTSAELLASLVALKSFGRPVVGEGHRASMQLRCGGGTDNKSTSHLVRKRLSTKWPVMIVLMDFLGCCEQLQLRCHLDWRPRDANVEADQLTNGIFTAFDSNKRLDLRWNELEFPMIKLLMAASETFSKRKFEMVDGQHKPTGAKFVKSTWGWDFVAVGFLSLHLTRGCLQIGPLRPSSSVTLLRKPVRTLVSNPSIFAEKERCARCSAEFSLSVVLSCFRNSRPCVFQ